MRLRIAKPRPHILPPYEGLDLRTEPRKLKRLRKWLEKRNRLNLK